MIKEKTNKMLFILCVFTIIGNSSCKKSNKTQGLYISKDSTHPSHQQIAYQQKERIAFVHFGVNTFTNRGWGTGNEDPKIFNPTNFDADQWARVLSETGFKTLILTAKHHDGFCLWPSNYTDHDISNSPYKNGNGDILKEVSEACQKYGLDFGVYLSPWDMHEGSYGSEEYNSFYENQLRELLTQYGSISEVWFDGAKGKNARDMTYNFKSWWQMIRKHQPNALIFSDEGPDIRWIGNEHGFAGKTNWSTINRDSVTIGRAGQGDYLNTGIKGAPDWVVGECDVSIRPGWFYHPEEDSRVKSAAKLTDIYFKSVGRNCTLLLNIPPDTTGQFSPTDVQRLYSFSDTLSSIFDQNLITASKVKTSSTAQYSTNENITDKKWNSFWISKKEDLKPRVTLNFDSPVTFNLLTLQEYIAVGQRVAAFKVEIADQDGWQTLASETTIGYKRILSFDKTTTDQLRITFIETTKRPAISEIALYLSKTAE